jgi:dephospho-CoA kinase
MRLAFVGHAAVGKDTLADYVSKKLVLTSVSSGDLVRKYIIDNNLGTLERENIRKVVNELRAERGGDYLVKEIMNTHATGMIITGLRAVDEVKTFKKLGGIIIAVTASAERRFALAKMRNRIDDTVTFEAWKKAEEGDDHHTDPAKGNVSAVIAVADFVIENIGTLDELFKDCDEVIEKIVRLQK